MLNAAGRLLTAYASLPGVMFGLKDASDGRYLAASQSLAEFYGRPLDDVLGRNDTELLDPTLGAAMRAADQTALAHGRQLTSEHRFDWRDNKHDWEVLRLVTELGARRVLACLWRDLAPQRLREAQLQAAIEQIEQHQIATQQLRREFGEQLMRDTATGLATRANFEDQLRREVDLSTREHREFAMVLIETRRRQRARRCAGRARRDDQVLEAMGRLLRGNTRAMDASCRCDEPALRRAAVGRGAGHRAFAHGRACGANAPRRSWCSTARSWASPCRWGWPAFRTRRTRRGSCWPPARRRSAEARRRGGNTSRWPASASTRLSCQRAVVRPLSRRATPCSRPARNSRQANTARQAAHVAGVGHPRAQRSDGHAGRCDDSQHRQVTGNQRARQTGESRSQPPMM